TPYMAFCTASQSQPNTTAWPLESRFLSRISSRRKARAVEEYFLVVNSGLGWAWLFSDFCSDARLCFMNRKDSGTISSTTTPSRRVTKVNRSAPIILELLAEFRKLSEFLARF